LLDHDLMRRHRQRRRTRKLFAHRFRDVVRHKGLAIVLADMAVGDITRLRAQVARKLPAEVVLHNDGLLRALQQPHNLVAVQRHQPANLQLVGLDSLPRKLRARLADCSIGRAHPIRVTSASAGPSSFGFGTIASMPCTLRMRFSIIRRRLAWLVYSSEISTPFSSCSSDETTCVWPSTPGMARGDTPLSVIL